MGTALEKADDYVWVYSETPKWWAGDDAKPASWMWQRFATEAWHWSGRPYTLGDRA